MIHYCYIKGSIATERYNMSLTLEYTSHSWYKGWAINKNTLTKMQPLKWTAVTDDGVYSYAIISVSAKTLKELKEKITEKDNNYKQRIESMYK